MSDFSGLVEVYRPPEEVTAPTFLASLEGKCVTDEHPTQFIDSGNAKWHCCGHVQNVRVAPEPLQNGDRVIVGDLIVMDESLIHKIGNGKKELSVGYEYKLTPDGDGGFEMRNLVANHVSVVETGRAGPMCAILDHALNKGRPCHCQRELERVTDRDDVAEINFAAAAQRFLGRNVLEVAEQRKNR